MPSVDVLWTPRGFGQTARQDRWWVQPLLVFLGLLYIFGLRELGGLSGQVLFLGTVLVAVLFARTFW
jgi:hypothetical protein